MYVDRGGGYMMCMGVGNVNMISMIILPGICRGFL